MVSEDVEDDAWHQSKRPKWPGFQVLVLRLPKPVWQQTIRRPAPTTQLSEHAFQHCQKPSFVVPIFLTALLSRHTSDWHLTIAPNRLFQMRGSVLPTCLLQ